MWKQIGGIWINDRMDKEGKPDWYISGAIDCPVCKNNIHMSAFKNKHRVGKQPDMKVFYNTDDRRQNG